MKILIVDDEKLLCKNMKDLLEKREYGVCLAHDAEEALEFLKTSKFDVVILDVCLPRISGMSLLKTIRNRGSLTQVIMMSGYGSKEIALECLVNGAYDFIFKPFRMACLLEVLDEIKQKMNRWNKSGIMTK